MRWRKSGEVRQRERGRKVRQREEESGPVKGGALGKERRGGAEKEKDAGHREGEAGMEEGKTGRME